MELKTMNIDRAFFLRDEAATEVRAACIDFIKAWVELSRQTDVDRVVPESRLEDARARLVELGVAPGMHVGRDLIYFSRDPVEAAQYCAGQLLSTSVEHADNIKLSEAFFRVDDAGAFSIDHGTEAAVLSGSNPRHEQVLRLAAFRDVVTVITCLLDAHHEVHADNNGS